MYKKLIVRTFILWFEKKDSLVHKLDFPPIFPFISALVAVLEKSGFVKHDQITVLQVCLS